MPVRWTSHRHDTFVPVTLGHIHSHGCRDLLVYCSSGHRHHSALMNADGPRMKYPAVPGLAHGLNAVRTDRRLRAARLVAPHEQAARLIVMSEGKALCGRRRAGHARLRAFMWQVSALRLARDLDCQAQTS